MIDAQTFGAELAGIVKSATAPLIARIDALEKQLTAVSDRPAGLTAEQLADQLKAVEDRAKSHADAAMQKAAESKSDDEPEVLTVEDIKALIADGVEAAVSALPPAEKGADGRDGADGKDGSRGEKGESGADGVGLAGALIDRDGNLVITLTNGEAKSLGVVVGKDGQPGADGKNGADGLGFEDLEFVTDEHGRAVAKFQRGNVVKSVKLPCIIDRGPYRAGDAYEKGDAVSYGGSLWIAQTATGEKPESGDGWRLAAKKGRDGKDGVVKHTGGK